MANGAAGEDSVSQDAAGDNGRNSGVSANKSPDPSDASGASVPWFFQEKQWIEIYHMVTDVDCCSFVFLMAHVENFGDFSNISKPSHI